MTESPPEPQRRSGFRYVALSVLSGGFAGGLAKTAIAPLDRVKILFQTHNADFKQFTGSWRGVGNALRFIVRTQGIRGLYQGHTLTLARAIPHAAVGYTVYDAVVKFLMPTPADQTSTRRFLAGAVTGLAGMPLTYPFELIRVRMAVDTKHSSHRPSPWTAMHSIWLEGRTVKGLPMLHFYRGFTVSLLGTIPYRGGIFFVWETLNARVRQKLRPEFIREHQTRIHLAVGAVAGTVAQITTYPLEVIRRTQQASGSSSPHKMIGVRETVAEVLARAGWRGFFAGMGIGLVKQVPMHSISLATWQASKRVLDV